VAPPAVQQPQVDPVPTGTPPAPVAPGDHPLDPAWCLSSQVAIDVLGGDAATGHRMAVVGLTNIAEDACVLPDYPDVAFADEHGVAVDAAVRHGGGFMTDDPGPAALLLQPGASAHAELAWDATDGRSTIPTLYAAPVAGAERQYVTLDHPFDITAESEVAVTAWQSGSGPSLEP
jgi:hypothetical protein